MIRRNPYRKLEKKLGYHFRDRSLLRRALTHPSHAHEAGLSGVNDNNQRLEFLGDAALDLFVADHLYSQLSEVGEGVLTKQRSQLVSTRALAEVARSIDLGVELLLGKGEAATGGARRDSNLADLFEAVVGAAWLDGGLKAVQKICTRLIVPQLGEPAADHGSNAKGRLQEFAQRTFKQNPTYEISDASGPAHAPEFTAVACLDGRPVGEGSGSSKRAAEMAAAEAALSALQEST